MRKLIALMFVLTIIGIQPAFSHETLEVTSEEKNVLPEDRYEFLWCRLSAGECAHSCAQRNQCVGLENDDHCKKFPHTQDGDVGCYMKKN